jgi:predicted transglutaminase-like cysteine proteinase
MWISRLSRWPQGRAVGYGPALLVIGVVLTGQCALADPFSSNSAAGSEPFGMDAHAWPAPSLQEKWLAVAREVEAEEEVIALCQERPARCQSAAALQLLKLVDIALPLEGRARFGVINRAINLAIKPVDDLDGDIWSSPLATLAKGAGDCEDYAIAKLVALRVAGVDRDSLRLTIVHDNRRSQDHAVVAARLDDHWLILDNQRLAMLEDREMNNIQPTASIDLSGNWRRPGSEKREATGFVRLAGSASVSLSSRNRPKIDSLSDQ